jgi:hypothetical protein
MYDYKTVEHVYEIHYFRINSETKKAEQKSNDVEVHKVEGETQIKSGNIALFSV